MGKKLVNWKHWGVDENKDKQWIRLRARWKSLIDSKGGRCIKCGESHPSCLEFHHRGEDSKVDQISWMIMGYRGGNMEMAKEEVEKCDLLCRNCHYDIHYPAKEGNAFKKRCLDITGVWACEECGYNDNLSCLDFHHKENGKDGTVGKMWDATDNELREEIGKCIVVCKNCHKKKHWNSTRYKKWFRVIEECAWRIVNGKNRVEDYNYLKPQIEKMKRAGVSNDVISKKFGISRELLKDLCNDIFGDVSPRTGFLTVATMDSMSDSELRKRKEVHQFLHWRAEGWTGGAIRKALGMNKQIYEVWVRYFVDKGWCEKRSEVKDEIWDERIKDHMIPATQLAKELGCAAETIRKKRRKLVDAGEMEPFDASEYFKGRQSPLKGVYPPLNEVQKIMIEKRKEGKKAAEVAQLVGKTPAAVRNFWSKMKRQGRIKYE